MDQSLHSDELDARPQPIVAIPRRWSRLQYLATMIPTIPLVALFWLKPDMARLRQAPWATGWVGWIAPFWPMALMMAVFVPAMIWMGLLPAFAVFKDGIKVDFKRIPPGRSTWDPWSYGFYSWSEVSYCRWSPYRPGVLSVHVAAAEQHLPPAWFGQVPAFMMKVPPGVFFYPVPELLRAEVESAIRTYGKWAD